MNKMIFREQTANGKVAISVSLDEIRTIRFALKETADLLHRSWRCANKNEHDVIGEKESWCRDLLQKFPKGEIE